MHFLSTGGAETLSYKVVGLNPKQVLSLVLLTSYFGGSQHGIKLVKEGDPQMRPLFAWLVVAGTRANRHSAFATEKLILRFSTLCFGDNIRFKFVVRIAHINVF